MNRQQSIARLRALRANHEKHAAQAAESERQAVEWRRAPGIRDGRAWAESQATYAQLLELERWAAARDRPALDVLKELAPDLASKAMGDLDYVEGILHGALECWLALKAEVMADPQ